MPRKEQYQSQKEAMSKYRKEHKSITVDMDVYLHLKSIAALQSYEQRKVVTPSDVVNQLIIKEHK